MNVHGLSKAGVLFGIVAAALLMVPNGFAADQPAGGISQTEAISEIATQKNVNVKALDEEVSHMEVIDSNGNVYLLVPIKSTGGNEPAVAKDGKIIVEYVHPYVGRLGN